MKTAVVDVGGGMRGIYAAGVLDYCLDQGITFDLGIGVSAGSANISSFVAGQRGRNYPFYTDYPHRKEYMGLHELVRDRAYLNLDYVYGTLSNSDGENPLGVLQTSKTDNRLAKRIQKNYPVSAEQLRGRAERYNNGIALAKQYASQGKLCIIAPDDTCGVDTLTKDRQASHRLYEKGYADGEKVRAFLARR